MPCRTSLTIFDLRLGDVGVQCLGRQGPGAWVPPRAGCGPRAVRIGRGAQAVAPSLCGRWGADDACLPSSLGVGCSPGAAA